MVGLWGLSLLACSVSSSPSSKLDAYVTGLELMDNPSEFLAYWVYKTEQEHASAGRVVPEDIRVIAPSGEQQSLLSLQGDSFPLFLFFPSTGCDACLRIELQRLQRWVEQSELEIVLLSSFESDRALNFFGQWYQTSLPYFDVERKVLDLPLVELEQPFYFQIDQPGRYQYLFVPVKEFPDATEAYVERALRLQDMDN